MLRRVHQEAHRRGTSFQSSTPAMVSPTRLHLMSQLIRVACCPSRHTKQGVSGGHLAWRGKRLHCQSYQAQDWSCPAGLMPDGADVSGLAGVH